MTCDRHRLVIEMRGDCADLFPKKSRSEDACYDLYSREEVTIPAKGFAKVPTGVYMQFSKELEGIVRGRSGMACKGIFAHVGTIDSNYRGEVSVILFNFTEESYQIKRGDRIAQFQLQKIPKFFVMDGVVETNTERGSNGFGSSGI